MFTGLIQYFPKVGLFLVQKLEEETNWLESVSGYFMTKGLHCPAIKNKTFLSASLSFILLKHL